MAAPKLFLIDAHALCYRSFFAIKGLATSKGQGTNAIYGFVNTLRKILREYKPDYMAVCFDSKEKTHRQEKFNAYKIQRPVMPRDLIDQMPVIKDVVAAHNLAVFECPGFEADDIIATVVRRLGKEKLQVVIVSDDKDMYQLADPHTTFFSTRKDMMVTEKELKETLGFDPTRMTDFIALAGDQSDNIPGVNGIGEVTARRLITRYGTLENILEHLDEITPAKLREKLQNSRQEAVLSKELAVLTEEVPLRIELDQLKVRPPQTEHLKTLFQELEFHKFARELAGPESSEDAAALQTTYTSRDIPEVIAAAQKQGRCVVLPDFQVDENDALLYNGIVIAVDPGQALVVPVERIGEWKELLESQAVLKITYNLKELIKILNSAGLSPEKEAFDVLLAGYLCGAAQGSLDLDALAWTYLKKTVPPDMPAGRRAALLAELYPAVAKDLHEKSLAQLLDKIETPLAYVLADMENCGVKLDIELLNGLSKECERKIQDLTGKLYSLAGEEFNLNSPKQLGHVLFERLKLPTVKKTKTGFSTNEEVLTILAAQHEFPALVLEYRQLAKLKSTYIDALPRLVNPATGRVHAQFNQTGPETGRLSSSRPNLQNIPVRTELGRQIRKAVVALAKDHVLVSADYSQVELRILAHISKDEDLMKAFEEDQDIHSYTASLIFDVPEKNVTPQMRDSAKRVNFGIIYGMSAFGLAKDLGISQQEAQEFIDRYFLRYPKVKLVMEKNIEGCRQRGFVTTLLNRRRYIPQISSPNDSMRQFAERQAINTPVQGSAADLIKLAMVDIHGELKKRNSGAKILISVHDELVLDVPKTEEHEIAELVRRRMEHSLELSVPVRVSVKAGPNWLEMKEI
ncbi:MAG: DNA polymerase I [Candidatus Omnitrophica bacterium]|nr:DNA polymerase I [Candidatus Omnitrophota bacterium]